MNIDYNQYLMLHGSLLYEVKIRHLWHPEKKPRITQIGNISSLSMLECLFLRTVTQRTGSHSLRGNPFGNAPAFCDAERYCIRSHEQQPASCLPLRLHIPARRSMGVFAVRSDYL